MFCNNICCFLIKNNDLFRKEQKNTISLFLLRCPIIQQFLHIAVFYFRISMPIIQVT